MLGGLAGFFFGIWYYQKERLTTVVFPDKDPRGSGYQVLQSKIAIGSGGVLGKGFAKGSQSQLKFLPARHTDFVFSVFAEEWGFAGALLAPNVTALARVPKSGGKPDVLASGTLFFGLAVDATAAYAGLRTSSQAGSPSTASPAASRRLMATKGIAPRCWRAGTMP